MKKIKEHIEIIVLLIAVLFVCIPLFKDGFIDTHDGHFHISRIFGTTSGILDGQFLPEVVIEWGNGFGFSWNLFYPPLVTYVGALLKLILPTYVEVLKLILVILTAISGIGMYKLMYEITEKKKISLLVAVIYLTVPYRLTDVFVRLAIGEVMTFAFMPILFQGLYNLFNKDGKKSHLIVIGAVGIVLSHNISTLLIAGISVIYVLIHITKLKDKNILLKLIISAVFIILIVLFFYGPLLESKLSANYSAFDKGFMMTKEGFEKQVLHINQLFDNNFRPGRSYELGQDGDGTNEMNFAIGLQIIIPLLLVPFIFKKIKKETRKDYFYFLILGLICTFATTVLFPWKYMPDLFTILQAPWRLLMPATFLLSIAAGMTIDYEFEKIETKYLIVAIVACLIYVAPYFFNLSYVETFDENAICNARFSTLNCSNFEYFPTNARKNMDYIEKREDKAIILEGNATIENENKKGTNMTFDITENSSENLKIELPYIYYIGYNVKLNDEEITITETENGFLEINIPEQKTGTIKVEYTGTTVMNVTKIISIFSTLIFIIYCFRNRLKNRSFYSKIKNEVNK